MRKSTIENGPGRHKRFAPPLSILIVDDFEVTRSALAHLIAMRMPDATIQVADDYASTISLCSHHDIDIVITDMKRASLQGPDIFERITSAKQGVKLILMTGSSDREELADVSRLANAHLLEKPVDFSQLIEVMQSFADDKSGE